PLRIPLRIGFANPSVWDSIARRIPPVVSRSDQTLRNRSLELSSALGQAEHTLPDDVVLNLVRAGRDGAAPGREHPMRPLAMIDRARGLVLELAMRAQQLHRERLDSQVQIRGTQFHDRAFGAG